MAGSEEILERTALGMRNPRDGGGALVFTWETLRQRPGAMLANRGFRDSYVIPSRDPGLTSPSVGCQAIEPPALSPRPLPAYLEV